MNQKLIIIVVATVVATAIIIGGGVYLIQKSAFDKEKEQLQQQINGLNNEIMRLQDKQDITIVSCAIEDEMICASPGSDICKRRMENSSIELKEQCCDGLTALGVYDIVGSECYRNEGVAYCAICGDGSCSFGENQCSCPNDCPHFSASDWQTYQNKELGFEFKFPSGSTIIEKLSYPSFYYQRKNELKGKINQNTIVEISNLYTSDMASVPEGQEPYSLNKLHIYDVDNFNVLYSQEKTNTLLNLIQTIEEGTLNDLSLEELNSDNNLLSILWGGPYVRGEELAIKSISINGVNGIKTYAATGNGISIENPVYLILLSKNSRIYLFEFHPVGSSEYDKVAQQFLEKYTNTLRGYESDYIKFATQDNGIEGWNTEVKKRFDVFDDIVSTFKFID